MLPGDTVLNRMLFAAYSSQRLTHSRHRRLRQHRQKCGRGATRLIREDRRDVHHMPRILLLHGVWGATEQKTGLSTGCRQPLDRRDVNIERLGAVRYILSLVQLVELPGRPNCTSRFLATLRARVGCTSVPARSSRPELGQSSCSVFAKILAKRLGFARYCCEREFPSLSDPIQCLSVS
jgi:hypothetical protein